MRLSFVRALAAIAATLATCGWVFTAGTPCASAAAGNTSALLNKTVTLRLDRAPIRAALEALFQGRGVNYTISPAVHGVVTATLQDVPFDVALRTLLRADNPPLTYSILDGIYQIKPRNTTYDRPAVTRSSSPTKSKTNDANSRVVRVPLEYGNAALLMQYALGGGRVIPPSSGLPQNGSRGNGSRMGGFGGRGFGGGMSGFGGGRGGFGGGFGGRGGGRP